MSVARRIALLVSRARGGRAGMIQTVLAQTGVMIVNVVTGIITARALGPIGRGEFAAASIWFMLPSLLATAGSQSGLVYQARRDPDRANSIGAAGLLLGFAIYVPAAIFCLMLLPVLMHSYRPAIVMLARDCVVAALLNVWMILARQSLLGKRNMHLFNLSSAASPLTYLLFLLAIFACHMLTPTTAMIAQVAATLFVLIVTLWWLVRDWNWAAVRPLSVLRSLAGYSARAAGIDLVTVFYWNVDRIVLIGIVSPAQFGLYAVAVSFSRLITIFQTAASSVTLADLSNRSANEIEVYIHQMLRMMFWLLLAGCIAGWLLGGVLLQIVYGSNFTAAATIFRVMLLECSASCLSQIIVEAFLASGDPGYPSRIQAAYGVLLLAMMLLLAPVLGGLGAALAMLVAVTAKLLLLLLGFKRINIGWPRLVLKRSDFGFARALLSKLSAGERTTTIAEQKRVD